MVCSGHIRHVCAAWSAWTKKMKQLQHVAVTAKGAPASAPFFTILADDVTGFVRAKAPSWRELAPKATEGVKCQSIVSIVSLCRTGH